MKRVESFQEKYARAQARVEELKHFYNHLTIYSLVNLGLAGFNYYSNQWEYPWFLFPLLGWGIGLASHAVRTFKWNPLTTKDWEARKLRELMEREETNNL